MSCKIMDFMTIIKISMLTISRNYKRFWDWYMFCQYLLLDYLCMDIFFKFAFK